MGDLDAVIAGALSSAREAGTLEPPTETIVEDPVVPDPEPTAGDPPAGGDGDAVVPPAEGAPKSEEKKPEAKVEKPVEKPVEQSDEDLDGTNAEALKKKAGADNRIPHSEVARISNNRERKTNLAVAAKLGIQGFDAKNYDPVKFTAALDTHVAEVTELRNESQAFRKVYPIMKGNPDEFMKRLVQLNPEYANFVRKGTDTGESKVDADDPNDPEPLPDIDLGNGKKQYSEARFKELRAWDKRQAAREARAAAKKDLDERFKPIDAANKEREEYEKGTRDLSEYVSSTLARARTWRGFNEHEAEIQELVTKGEFKGLPFHEAVDKAYDRIVLGKLTTDYDTMYARVMADIKKQAGETSVTSGAPPAKPNPKDALPDTAEEGDDSATLAIKRSLQQARAKGKLK